MDLSISRTTSVSPEPAKKPALVLPPRKSGSRQEGRKKKDPGRSRSGNAVVVRLSSRGVQASSQPGENPRS